MRRPSLSVLIICIILMIFPACSQSPDIQAGSASFTIRISDAVSKTISPDIDTDVSHYRLSVLNDAEGESAISSSFILPKGKSSFEVRNIPGGYTYQAKAEALIDPHGDGSYIVIAEGQSSPMLITGDGAVMDIELDSLSRGDGYESGFVRIQAVLPDGFSAESYSWIIHGLDDVVLFESGAVNASGTTGALSISIDPENVLGGDEKLYQGAYLFRLSVKGTINGASAEYSGVDYMRLMPGLDAEGRVYLSYEENADLTVSVINSLGSPIDLGENDTVEEQIPGDTLDLLISPSGGFSSLDSLSVVCYMDGNSIGTAETDYAWYSHEVEGDSIALGLKGLSTIPSGDHLLTIIVLDTAAGADYSIGMKTVTFTCVGGIPIGDGDYIADISGNAYHVFTAAGLYAWAEAVKEKPDLGLILEADIVMPAGDADSPNWESVHLSDEDREIPYTGVIDGKGHLISGLVIKTEKDSSGFIGYAGEGFSVQDLTISGSMILLTPMNTSAGFLSGYMEGDSSALPGEFRNCFIEGDILFDYAYEPDLETTETIVAIGGLIGNAERSMIIDGCTYEGSIRCASGMCDAGGMIGFSDAHSLSFEECRSEADIIASKDAECAGGIIGRYDTGYSPMNLAIADCFADVTVCIESDTGDSDEYSIIFIGGIAGLVDSYNDETAVMIADCRTTGFIQPIYRYSLSDGTGGIVGRLNSDSDETVVIDCVSDIHIDGTESFNIRIGGIIGTIPSKGTVRRCSFEGELQAGSSCLVGGISGTVYEALIDGCSVSGSISNKVSLYYIGGILGRTSRGSVVRDCVFSGSIISTYPMRDSDPKVGGILGYAYPDSYIIGCYTHNAKLVGAASICGLNEGNIIACYSTDDIITCYSTEEYPSVAGIVWENAQNGKVIACYHKGAFLRDNGFICPGLAMRNGAGSIIDSCYWESSGSETMLCSIYEDLSQGAGVIDSGEATGGWDSGIADAMNAAIADWNAENPEYACGLIYELTGNSDRPLGLAENII